MPPKGKRPALKGAARPSAVPRLITVGGIEVLNIKTGPDTLITIEAFLNPRAGHNDPSIPTPLYQQKDDTDDVPKEVAASAESAGPGSSSGSSGNSGKEKMDTSTTVNGAYYGYSDTITVSTDFSTDILRPMELPCYSMAEIQLPPLNTDLTCDTILMWEAVSCKTEVIGANTLMNVHSAMKRTDQNGPADFRDEAPGQDENREAGIGAGVGFVGPSFHMFSVGGEPLDVQFICANHQANYKDAKTYIVPDTVSAKAQGLDPSLKAKLTADGKFPVECWTPDPVRNENTRYFGSVTTGPSTPNVLNFTNTTTTILLNENGVGPLCKGEKLFLTSADVVGFLTQPNLAQLFRGLPRVFNVQLRKRIVRNPYPITRILNSVFNSMQPAITGQSRIVEEVRVYEGTEPLPGDPDLVRIKNQYGQEVTVLPNQIPQTPLQPSKPN